MKHSVAIFFLLSSIALHADQLVWHEAKIVNYPSNEYAVKGDVERQLTNNVIVPIAKETVKDHEGIKFFLIGSTDRTGNPAFNDELGQKRAEQVKEVLLQNFPNAEVVSTVTKGNDPDKKMVVVRWIFVPRPKGYSKIEWILISLILLIAGLVLIGVILRPKKTIPVINSTRAKNEPAHESVVATWHKNGLSYQVSITFRDGKWYTPFLTEKGPKMPVWKSTPAKARAEVKGRFENPKFDPEVQRLIEEKEAVTI